MSGQVTSGPVTNGRRMRAPVLRSQLAEGARRPRRVLLMGLAMIIAATVVYGAVLARQTAERTLLDGFSGTPAATDLVIAPGDETASTVALAAARQVPGVAEAVGRGGARVDLAVPGARDRGSLDLLADPGTGPLATVRTVEGRYPDAPDEIAVSHRTTERLGLPVGTALELRYGPDPAPTLVRVVGIVESDDDSGEAAYAVETTVAAIVGANTLDQVDVRLTAGAEAQTVRAELEQAIAAAGAAAPVGSGDDVRRAEAERAVDNLADLFTLVAMFVAVSVVAAALVVTATFRIVFAQRMRQLALLRVIGAARARLLRALVIEGALVGLLAGVIGVLAALAAGLALPPLLRGLGVQVLNPGIPVGPAVAVVLGSAVLTTLAALAPAATAARVSPLEALRTADTTAGQRGIGPVRTLVGIGLAVGAALLALRALGRSGGPAMLESLLVIVLSGTLAYTALVVLGPALVRPVLAVVGWPLRRIGPLGRLATGSVGAAPRRAAAVGVVVALGVTLIAGALIVTASLGATLRSELALWAPADYEVLGSSDDHGELPPGLVERVDAIDGVERTVPYRTETPLSLVGTPLDEVVGTDLDLRTLRVWPDLVAESGSLDELGPGQMVMSGAYADAGQLSVGDTVTVARDSQSVSLKLVATVGSAVVGAALLLDPADLDALGVPAAPTGLLVDAAAGDERDRTAMVQALRDLSGPAVTINVPADGRADLEGNLISLVPIMFLLLGLAVVIAVVGVGTITGLSVVERIRECGLLRSLGLSRARLRAMLILEASLYGVVGAAAGLLLALPYAAVTLAVFDQHTPVRFPVPQLALVVLTLAVATGLAGVPAARRAARVSPVTALGAGE